MIEPLVALTVLAIYIGATIAVIATVRSEVWQIRQARERFYTGYVEKVTRLEKAKETELISTIYKSEQLKGLYARPSTPAVELRLTPEERLAVDKEIEGIKTGLKAVSDARGMFDRICNDFSSQADSLHRTMLRGIGLSLTVPAGVIVVALLSSVVTISALLAAPYVASVVAYIGFLILANPANEYRKAGKRLGENQKTFTKIVEETIYGLPPSPAETPPAASQ
jgi:ABC-type multidrug transport system fused ATPase/permease subunit